MRVRLITDRETAATMAKAETMLALAEHVGISLDTLAFVARRFELRLGILDAAEPARRVDLERLAAEDFEELATAYKGLARMVERVPSA
jgi:hypothetical protein